MSFANSSTGPRRGHLAAATLAKPELNRISRFRRATAPICLHSCPGFPYLPLPGVRPCDPRFRPAFELGPACPRSLARASPRNRTGYLPHFTRLLVHMSLRGIRGLGAETPCCPPGGSDRTRTRHLVTASHALYLMSYRPMLVVPDLGHLASRQPVRTAAVPSRPVRVPQAVHVYPRSLAPQV